MSTFFPLDLVVTVGFTMFLLQRCSMLFAGDRSDGPREVSRAVRAPTHLKSAGGGGSDAVRSPARAACCRTCHPAARELDCTPHGAHAALYHDDAGAQFCCSTRQVGSVWR